MVAGKARLLVAAASLLAVAGSPGPAGQAWAADPTPDETVFGEGFLVGGSLGLGGPVWSTYSGNSGLRDDQRTMVTGTLEAGYRRDPLEFVVVLHGEGLRYALGAECLWHLPILSWVWVGGGLAYLPDRGGAELVFPRLDVRVPLSYSWEVVATPLRLSYFDETLSGAKAEERRVIDGHEQFSFQRVGRGLDYEASLGLRARLDALWQRATPPPPTEGLFFRGGLGTALLGAVAEERGDSLVVGLDSPIGRKPGARMVAELRLEPGWRLGSMELGLPLSLYPVQSKVGVGVAARWHPPRLDWLAVAAEARYFPWRWVILALPQVELHYRWSERFGAYLVPLYPMLVLEPTRDVWVEQGLSSKAPYWGLGFAAGFEWGKV